MNKNKVVVCILILSLALNVVGVVVTVAFFKLRNNYHRLSKQQHSSRNQPEAVANQPYADEIVGSMKVSKRSFVSHVDGAEDFYGVLPPSMAGRLDDILIVYLHGMGSNFMEPFIYPAEESAATGFAKHWANIVVLSCNYRQKQSWGNDKAMADISQNIREVEQQYPIKQIVLVGTSMGGCTALTYATEAPDDIKRKLVGVVSVEGAGDLAKLYRTTSSSEVQKAIADALGGTPDMVPQEYARKSFISNISKLKNGLKFAVVSATQDQIVPTPLQADIVQSLQNSAHPVNLIKVDSGHTSPASEIYVKAVQDVLPRP